MEKKITILDILENREPIKTILDQSKEEIINIPKINDLIKKDTTLKFDEGFPYFESLPEGYILCVDINQFYRLKKDETFWDKNTIEPIPDLKYCIFSPVSKKYWYRETHPNHPGYESLVPYMKDCNLYIKSL